jgi:hypothetical protein
MTTFRDSTVITGFDASPIVRPTSGQFGPVHRFTQTATILGVTGDTSSYVYRMIRLPTNSMVTRLSVANDAAVTTWAGSIGLYFSDTNDGTPALLQGSAFSVAFFGYQVDMHALVAWTDETFQNAGGNSVSDGFYVPSASWRPLWSAASHGGYQANPALFAGLGAATGSTTPPYHLNSDPGGFFDIAVTLTSTMSGAPVFSMMVEYAHVAQ